MEFLKQKKAIPVVLLSLSMGLAACSPTSSVSYNLVTQAAEGKAATHQSQHKNEQATKNLFQWNTKNVTRLSTANQIEAAVYTSQTVWPATNEKNRPGAIMLAPAGQWQIDLASSKLIHHPNDGPVLFTEGNHLSKLTLDEIKRLNPKGNKSGVQIYVMGDVDQKLLRELKEYKVERVEGTDPSTFARNVDKKYSEISGKKSDSVVIGSLEDSAKLYTIPAGNWIAHMPEPLLYVSKEKVPEATKEALKERQGKANIYILGPEAAISKSVETELAQYGKVVRIAGKDPVTTSIAFAKYKDEQSKFGWGFTEPGHGLSFVSTDTPDVALATTPFAHRGKHAPLIWLQKGEMTDDLHHFLMSIKPTFTEDPTAGPYNHAFLTATDAVVPYETQGMIDDMLEIEKLGEGH